MQLTPVMPSVWPPGTICTAVRIDLVVDGQQRAAGDFLGLLSVKGVHRQVFSRSELLEHRRQAVLRDGKDDRHGFELGDDT